MYMGIAGAAFAAGMFIGEANGYIRALGQQPVTHIRLSAYDPKMRPIAQVFFDNGVERSYTGIGAGVFVPHIVAMDIRKGELTLEDYLASRKPEQATPVPTATATRIIEKTPQEPVEDRRVMLAIKEDEDPIEDTLRQMKRLWKKPEPKNRLKPNIYFARRPDYQVRTRAN